jgi:GlpG protein
MRQIGAIANEAQARFFTDYLLSREIRSQLEPEADRSWSIWIQDEDQITDAQEALKRFQANPMAEEFQKAPEAAARAREKEAEDLAAYRKRVRSRRSLFPSMGNYGVGLLTFLLILICVTISAFSAFGNAPWLHLLYISDPENPTRQFLPEVFHGEVWRLVTPILMHADLKINPLHLLFNMMWLYQLGSMVEARQSALFLFFFVVISAALSNVAQYVWMGPHFAGMSGVVYALGGYIWIRGKYNPGSGLLLDRQTVTWLLIWMVVCMTGLVGHIANAAHFIGLVVGMAWGGLAALIATRHHE